MNNEQKKVNLGGSPSGLGSGIRVRKSVFGNESGPSYVPTFAFVRELLAFVVDLTYCCENI